MSKNSSRYSWTKAVFLAMFAALLLESVTVLMFYSYLDKENRVIAEQKAELLAAEQKNSRLLAELLNLNSSVSVVMTGIGTVNHAIETADKHLGSYEIHSELHTVEFAKMKSMVEMLRSENAALRSSVPKIKPSEDTANQRSRWLTIGIPTVPRKGNPDYLSQTVDAIIGQLPTRSDDPFYAKVLVVILNNRPQQHPVFDEVRKRVEQGSHSFYFKFVEAVVQDSDEVRNPEHDPNVPGSKVRPFHSCSTALKLTRPACRCVGRRVLLFR